MPSGSCVASVVAPSTRLPPGGRDVLRTHGARTRGPSEWPRPARGKPDICRDAARDRHRLAAALRPRPAPVPSRYRRTTRARRTPAQGPRPNPGRPLCVERPLDGEPLPGAGRLPDAEVAGRTAREAHVRPARAVRERRARGPLRERAARGYGLGRGRGLAHRMDSSHNDPFLDY